MKRVNVLLVDKSLDLAHPVTRYRRRADDQRYHRLTASAGVNGVTGRRCARRASMRVGRQHAQRLQRLAQTHVVTEDAVQVVLVEEAQPVDAVLCAQISDVNIRLQRAVWALMVVSTHLLLNNLGARRLSNTYK